MKLIKGFKMKKILMVVDYQNDFVDPKGALPVQGANKLVNNIQKRINSNEYEHTIYTFDTHTKEDYKDSDEQQLFPNIHCEYKTKGWDFYKIKPVFAEKFNELTNNKNNYFEMLENVFDNENYQGKKESFFTKNKFDIWEGNNVYEEWFNQNFDKEEYIIDVVGVATNYCVFMNVMGMIKRGYKVNIIEDCVEGIKNFPDGTIDPSFNANIETMKSYSVSFKQGGSDV
jgi:nicotinamidase/pyrazinamidase